MLHTLRLAARAAQADRLRLRVYVLVGVAVCSLVILCVAGMAVGRLPEDVGDNLLAGALLLPVLLLELFTGVAIIKHVLDHETAQPQDIATGRRLLMRAELLLATGSLIILGRSVAMVVHEPTAVTEQRSLLEGFLSASLTGGLGLAAVVLGSLALALVELDRRRP